MGGGWAGSVGPSRGCSRASPPPRRLFCRRCRMQQLESQAAAWDRGADRRWHSRGAAWPLWKLYDRGAKAVGRCEAFEWIFVLLHLFCIEGNRVEGLATAAAARPAQSAREITQRCPRGRVQSEGLPERVSAAVARRPGARVAPGDRGLSENSTLHLDQGASRLRPTTTGSALELVPKAGTALCRLYTSAVLFKPPHLAVAASSRFR